MPRLRFSLRWLLILFAVVAVILYFIFVRPTVVANRFASEINRGNLSELDRLYTYNNGQAEVPFKRDDRSFAAVVQPRTWVDTICCRRRIEVDATRDGSFAGEYILHSNILGTTLDDSWVYYQRVPSEEPLFKKRPQ
jgi:hypothetical protein